MIENFKIQIDDGSTILSPFSSKQNQKFLVLYEWQRNAIDYFFKHNHLALYEVATGTGKTILGIELIKRVWEKDPNINILIVVPKNVIMETGWYKELYENGIKLTDIGVYYGNIKEYAKITITNMQNIHRIPLELFQMVVWDEIHNFGTTRLLKYLDYPFKYRVGLSATIIRGDNAHWDIKRIFDYNVFTYTPKQGLQDGVLNPFDYKDVAVVMDDENMDKYLEITQNINLVIQMAGGFVRAMSKNDSTKLKLLKLLNERKQLVANYYGKFDVIRWICEKHRNNKILIFNEYNSQTNKCYWHLLEANINARIAHSGVNKEKRVQDLIDFKKDLFNVLLTSKVLDEGYNLPKIDVGVIMAGNSTARQTIQRLGRVLRRKTEKSILYQIYCKDTIEEKYSMQRSMLFQEICSDYKYYISKDGTII